MIDFGLAGQVVAVSGCASSFGQAIARIFVEVGAHVHGSDIDIAACTRLSASGVQVDRVDLTDAKAAAAWIAGIERLHSRPLSVLVNNAGGVRGQSHTPIESVTDQDWNDVIAINLGIARNLVASCLPRMKKAGSGVIIMIGSGAASRASMTGVQAYCVAKHALLGLTRQLAQELGPWGIRVNCVSPGFVATGDATARQWEALGADGQAALVDAIPLRRLGTPRDIARAVVFMASDLASFVTGENLSVNGGR